MKKVTIQGVTGCFHEAAARNYFKGEEIETVPCMSFPELFSAMAKESDLYGIMAIENTIAGSLLQNHELLRSSDLQIIGEYKLRISHVLAVLPGQTIDDITEVKANAGTAINDKITTDQVVAKVTMQVDDEIDMSEQTATLKNLTCQIGNAGNIEYDKDGVGDAKYTGAGTYLTAQLSGTARTTPYYSYTLNATDAEGFSQTELLSGTATSIYTDDGTVSQTQARFYCLENTHTSANYLQSNTTFVRVKAEMIPNSALTFTYAEGAVSVSEKADMPTELKTFYVITAAPDQSYNGSYVFESDLAAIYDDLIAEGTATTDADKAAAVITALGQNNRGYAFTEAYTGGAGYYNIWVNDMKDEDGSYLNIAPVFRNDWYDLTITSIQLPGDPNPDIDPEQPIHPNTNVAVTLSIRDWNKVSHNVDLQ